VVTVNLFDFWFIVRKYFECLLKIHLFSLLKLVG